MNKSNSRDKNNRPKQMTYYIDATNVCYWYDTTVPTLRVLLKLLILLKKEKNASFYCIFDANTTHKLHPDEREIYIHLLEHKNYFHQVSGGKRADDYILELADIYDAPVISNDNYSDDKYDRYAWKHREAEPMRLFMGEVINTPFGDHLLLPDLNLRAVLDRKINPLYRELESLFNPPKERYRGFVKF